MRRIRSSSTGPAQIADPDVSSVPAKQRTPRCGRVMLRYETAWGPLLDEVTCGRPEGHNPPCRSVQAVSAARLRDKAPDRVSANNRYRQARRVRARLAAAVTAAAEAARRQALER